MGELCDLQRLVPFSFPGISWEGKLKDNQPSARGGAKDSVGENTQLPIWEEGLPSGRARPKVTAHGSSHRCCLNAASGKSGWSSSESIEFLACRVQPQLTPWGRATHHFWPSCLILGHYGTSTTIPPYMVWATGLPKME